MRRSLLLAAFGSVGCTGTAAPPATSPQAPAEVAPEARADVQASPPVESPPVEATEALTWVWYHAAPAWLASAPGFGIGAIDHATSGDPPVRVSATLEAGEVVVRGGTAWERKIEGDAPVVLVQERGVFVATRTPQGAKVHGFERDGTPRFATLLPAAAVQGVQLGWCEPRICAYVLGEASAVHAIAVGDGKATGVARYRAELRAKDAKWPTTAVETKELGSKWAAGSTSHVVRAEGEKVVVERAEAGAVKWRVTLPEAQPFRDHALVTETRGVVLVVFHSPIASGVTAWGLEPGSGEIRWRADPPGIGPVSHSKYRNRVAVIADSAERMVIFGEESSGSYVATIDPTNGRVLTDEIWRR